MQAKQATSLRVDQTLYERMARLAKERGTSITRQLELAIRQHLEAAVVGDYLPVVQPAIERIVSESLEATVTAKIEEVKERLAALLAKNSLDTAVLYLMSTRQMSPEENQAWRKAAVSHVRGRLAELQGDALASEERNALRRKLEQVTAQAQQQEKKATSASAEHQEQIRQLRAQLDQMERVIDWHGRLLRWLEAEWDKSGLLGRRKSLQVSVAEFEQQAPRPRRA